MTFAVFAAAAALSALGVSGQAGDLQQATKYLCRPTATSTISTPPVCRGGGPLEAQPICFCRRPDQMREEPACNRDGTPALFSRGHKLSKIENDKLISCQDYARRNR